VERSLDFELAAGKEFSVPCIFVPRVRDGVIVESADLT
jgi:hypothetical protein